MTTLHLVREGDGPPLAAIADRDWIVYLHPALRLVPTGAATPLPAGPITYDQLVTLVAAADRVIVW